MLFVIESLYFQALQVCMQPVIETLIHVDRILYLREHGISARLEPVFDEEVSPRNTAILAVR